MCAFYDDEQKIKKGDTAIYKNRRILIISAKHITQNKTMDITYVLEEEKDESYSINLPYKTSGYGLCLLHRAYMS